MDPSLASLPPGGTLVLRVIKRPPDPPPEEEYYDEEEYAEGEYAEGEYAEGEGEEYAEGEGAEEGAYDDRFEEEYQPEDAAVATEEEIVEEIVEEETGTEYRRQSEDGRVSPATKFREKRVLCTQCNSSFENYYMHFAHQKAEHKPVTCVKCKLIINGLDNLYRHCEQVHTDGPRFTCASCGATFNSKMNLQRHEKIHREDIIRNKPVLRCQECQYICPSQSLLSRHVHTAHRSANDSSEYKPYLCRICGSRFRYDFTYEAHLKSHAQSEQYSEWLEENDTSEASTAAKRIKLEIDPETEAATAVGTVMEAPVTTEESVAEQLVVKTGEDSEDELENYHLDKDQLVMTSDKPYQCHKCNLTFRWKVSLQVHLRLHDQPDVPMARYTLQPQIEHKVMPRSLLTQAVGNRPDGKQLQPIYLIRKSPKSQANSQAEQLQNKINEMASRRMVIYRPPESEEQPETSQAGVQTVVSANGQNLLVPQQNTSVPVPRTMVQNKAYTEGAQTLGSETTFTTFAQEVAESGDGEQHSIVLDESMINNATGPVYIQGPDGQLLEIRQQDSQQVSEGETLVAPENGVLTEQAADGSIVQHQEAVHSQDSQVTYTMEDPATAVKVEEGATQEVGTVQDNAQFIADGNVLVTEGEPPEQMVVVPPAESNQGEMIMTTLRLQNETWCGSLCCTLAEMQQDQTMCNVTLVGSDGQSVSAHSCLVAAASPCLKDLLVGVKKGAHSVLKFDTISSDLWRLLVEFIYSGKVEVPIANVSDIMLAATHLQIEGLATLCADLLKQYDPNDNIIVQLQIEDWSVHVCGVLHQFWQTGAMCDTTLTTGDGAKAFTVACVLAAASPTFRSILSSMKQGIYNIRTDQITKDAWDYLFQFMFTGECEVPVGKDLVSLYQATEQLNMAALKSLCEDCISSLGPEALATS